MRDRRQQHRPQANLEAALVQARSLVLDAPLGDTCAKQILRREKFSADRRTGRLVWVRFDRDLEPLVESSMDHQDRQRHVMEAGAVQMADVNSCASRTALQTPVCLPEDFPTSRLPKRKITSA